MGRQRKRQAVGQPTTSAPRPPTGSTAESRIATVRQSRFLQRALRYIAQHPKSSIVEIAQALFGDDWKQYLRHTDAVVTALSDGLGYIVFDDGYGMTERGRAEWPDAAARGHETRDVGAAE